LKFLFTGAHGFIDKNLVLRLCKLVEHEVFTFVRGQSDVDLHGVLAQADVVVHLAGENRPTDLQAFVYVNTDLTARICKGLQDLGKKFLCCWPLLPKRNKITPMAEANSPLSKWCRRWQLSTETLWPSTACRECLVLSPTPNDPLHDDAGRCG
jgi:hypothetical protein